MLGYTELLMVDIEDTYGSIDRTYASLGFKTKQELLDYVKEKRILDLGSGGGGGGKNIFDLIRCI